MDKLDVKLWTLAAKGQIVPDRSLLKTPEQIKAIQESADLNTAVLYSCPQLAHNIIKL